MTVPTRKDAKARAVWVTRLAALSRRDTRGIRRTRGALDALARINRRRT